MYKRATLPLAIWMEEGEDVDFARYFKDLKIESMNHLIRLEEIFDCCEGNEMPQRLLIKGQPGIGKTTLATKLAFDWANDAEYIQRFDFVFFLRFRYLEKESVIESMKALASVTGFAGQEFITRLISDSEYNVLVILDGYDEIEKSKVKENADKILYRKELPDATVVVTCRTGLFQTDKKMLRTMFQGMSLKKKFYDKRVNIIGLEEDAVEELLLSLLDESHAIQLIKNLKFTDEFISKLFECPLIVMLMAYHYNCDKDTEFLANKTSLFKSLVNDFVWRKTTDDNNQNVVSIYSCLSQMPIVLTGICFVNLGPCVSNKFS